MTFEKNRVKELNEKLANSALSEFSDNERTAYEDVLHKQKIENEKLRKEYEALQDLSNIEKLAREDVGLAKNGEMPYQMSSR